ncbi:MAG: hypothetical protein DCC52_18220, partial [Chloroflexi bacterium]
MPESVHAAPETPIARAPINESVWRDVETAPTIIPLSSETAPLPENAAAPSAAPNERRAQNRLRILLATPSDVQTERALLTELVQEMNAHTRARFGLELELITPTAADIANAQSAVALTDIFIGVCWLHFGSLTAEHDGATNANYFAGTENDFTLALEQTDERGGGWLRTVIYRSIRPPLDLLHLNVGEYTRVQQFFERANALAGVYSETSELRADARARLEAWIYNYVSDLANALTEYGATFAGAGQLAEALADLEQAGALYRELDLPAQELNLQLQVAALYRQNHQAAQAADALDAAQKLALTLQDNNAAALALHQRGLLAADAQDWNAALEAFQRARASLQPDAATYRDILADEISAYEQLGDTARQTADNATAQTNYHNALALTQEIDDMPHAVVLWQKLAELATAR